MNRYVHDLTLRDTASSNPLIPPGKAELADVVRRNHGVVYTRPWVVDLILDLTGYDADANLVDAVAVEPSCGTGGFLEPMARRLSASCRRQGRALQDCDRSLRAFELDPESVVTSQRRVEKALVSCGWGETESRNAAEGWIRQADFLLEPPNALAASGEGADFVIGNPPYIRLEDIGADVADLYRSLFKSMTGRADIYVGFYEKALRLLKPGGVCGFICSDRWMLNQFGNKLRKLITEGFGVEAVLEMHGADAFHDEVLAYPAITVIRRADQGRALVARLGRDSESNVANVLVDTARRVRLAPGGDGSPTFDAASGVVVEEWFKGSDPWPCVSPERLKLLKHLEASFLPIQDEATGTKVGIGVATGADKIYLTTDKNLVENDRLLPLALGKDTFTGDLKWSGHYLVNPWEPDGTLADLNRYPLLKAYFEKNGEALKRRNVGKRNALGWYRTIDKVHHALTGTPKLLIPDIKNVAHPVLDPGTLYPHHNLYFVTSREWDLKVLGGILLSQVGQFFIECYAVRMQGGYWRFQAQYLRRIRVPNPDAIDAQQALLLSKAFDERDVDAATGAALAVYGIDGIPD